MHFLDDLNFATSELIYVKVKYRGRKLNVFKNNFIFNEWVSSAIRNNNNITYNSIEFIFIIIVLHQQPEGQLQMQHKRRQNNITNNNNNNNNLITSLECLPTAKIYRRRALKQTN
jgi:hypothetical protein